MKRVTSIVLALAMLLSLTAVAFANGLNPSADKTEVKAGDTLEVTYTVKEATSAILGIDTQLGFNADYFEYDREASVAATEDVAKGGATVSFNNNVVGTGADASVQVSMFFINNAKALNAGDTFAKLVVKAKQDVTAAQATDFKATVLSAKDKDDNEIGGGFTENTTLSVTVNPISGYTVAASGTKAVQVGEAVQVTLTVGNAESYNAYDMTVTYDANVLEYTSVAAVKDETPSVTDTNGTLRITGYGADKTCGTDNLVLSFKAKAVGEGTVTVTSAKVDDKANAIGSNAPEATVTGKTAVITVGGYTVTLPDAFEGAGTAAPGADYTFTAKDTSKKYDFTGTTMGGEAVEVVDNGDGSYTIKNVTGTLKISAVEKAAKAIIRETGNGWEKVNIVSRNWTGDGAEVDVGTTLTMMAVNAVDIKYLSMTVNGTPVQLINIGGRFQVTIPGTLVTAGEVNICLTYADPTTTSIVKAGDWSDVTDMSWEDATSVAAGTNLSFTMGHQEGFTYVVTANGTELSPIFVQGRYMYRIDGATYVKGGETLTITITKTPVAAVEYTVGVSGYVKLDGKSIFLITATATGVEDGHVLTYDGNQMYWSGKYNAYAWLVISEQSLDEVKTAAAGKMGHAAGTKIDIGYTGDVNQTGSIDINDAQLVWNMYNAQYADFTAVSVRKFLEADMTGDGALNVNDAAAVVELINK